MRRHARPPYLDYGTSRDLEIQPVQIRRSIISRSITSIAGSAVTDRASGVLSVIFVHQDYRAVLVRNELSTSDGHQFQQPPILRDGRVIRRGPSIRSDRVFRPRD